MMNCVAKSGGSSLVPRHFCFIFQASRGLPEDDIILVADYDFLELPSNLISRNPGCFNVDAGVGFVATPQED